MSDLKKDILIAGVNGAGKSTLYQTMDSLKNMPGINTDDKIMQLGTCENREHLIDMQEELLRFGTRFPSPSGASYYLGDDGTPWTDRPRETWITCRMAHVYSIGTILSSGKDEKEYKKLSESAIRGLLGELKDDVNGGWYAGINADGSIIESKQCYAHAFVILAATSGILAGIKEAYGLLDEAVDVYDKYFWDENEGLAVDTWNTDFSGLSDYRGINANMHSVEAFLAVYDAVGDKRYLERAGRIIKRVVTWAQNNNWRIPEHFKEDWTPDLDCQKETPDDPFKPYGATPGHGIEWARLITQWAFAMYGDMNKNGLADADKQALLKADDNIRIYIDAAVNLYNRAISDAWNCDGDRGIVYTTDWEGRPVVHDRMHWTLAEAINTSAVLFKVTGDEVYSSNYSEFMQYLDEVVHDKVNGSWYHQLDRNNQLMGTVWPGKSDIYHALQAMLIPYNTRIDVSIAKAVKEGFIDI